MNDQRLVIDAICSGPGGVDRSGPAGALRELEDGCAAGEGTFAKLRQHHAVATGLDKPSFA